MKQSPEFYSQSARVVAQALLGQRLVRLWNGRRVSGIIVETEAYCDHPTELDLACHGDRANNGRPTPRSAVMFGPAGHAYVYFTYGMHWMFNVVTGQVDQANAVLIRALEPVEGIESMVERRKRPFAELTNGPAKLAQALAIDKSLNGANLYAPDSVIWVEPDQRVDAKAIVNGPRLGLGQTPEPWYSIPWRYWLKDNPFVSR
ncbi:MAG: DNA-3-methyladenine glycosylase [Chloroflexota bacterium]